MRYYHPDFFRQPAGPFPQNVLDDAGRWFVGEQPFEGCGIVCGGKFVPCTNQATEPLQEFEIAGDVLAKAYRDGELEGVIHSHPGGPWWPSAQDMAGQLETSVPWAIMVPGEDSASLACHWGGVRPPVFDQGQHVARDFLHGVSDCYTLLRDYYAETYGRALDEFPRDWEWWTVPETPGGLYLDNLEGQGFEVISQDPQEYSRIAQPGDAYLMSIRSKVPNHAGIYLGGGLLLEHMHGRLSGRAPIARMLKHITHWLRLKA